MPRRRVTSLQILTESQMKNWLRAGSLGLLGAARRMEKLLLGWVAQVSEGAKSLQGVSTAFKYQFAISISPLSPVCGTQK